MSLKERIRAEGRALGFARVGFASAAERPEAVLLREWLGRGYAGEMRWMHRRVRERGNPIALAPWVRTLILATLPYSDSATGHAAGKGRISRYARGRDYHRVIKVRLAELGEVVRSLSPDARVHPVADTGAILEKPWASAAGLGWQGKHTNLIDPGSGSWLFIGELLTDLELDPDLHEITDRCGSCTRCLEACPTGAFPQPYVLDASRCISYLTIEHPGPIPEELRPAMGDWIFGCDVCQEVCPWNREPESCDPDFRSDAPLPDLAELLRLTPPEFRRRFAGTAVHRTGWRRLLRNAAVALGNSGDVRAVAPLRQALDIPDILIREHVVWALGRLGTEEALVALRELRSGERDPGVLAAISKALSDALYGTLEWEATGLAEPAAAEGSRA